jgi:hypothetical protein
VTPPAVAKAHKDTAQTLLHVERVGLAVLKGAVAQVGPGDPIVTARRSHDVVAATVLDIRRAARAQGAIRFAAEVAAAGMSLPIPNLDPPTDADRLAAERAARGYSDAILKQAQEWMTEHDAAQADPVLQAEAAKLETIAATETSSAFSDERTRVEKFLAEENKETSWWPFLVKVWDATLDKRTCPVCRKMHHEKRGWGTDWPSGKEPGKVHPNCRCLVNYHAIPIEVPGKTGVRIRPST